MVFCSPFFFFSGTLRHFICTGSSIQYNQSCLHSDFPVMIFPVSAAWNWTKTADLTSQQSMTASPQLLDYWGKCVAVPSPHLSLLQTQWQLCCPQMTPTPTEDFQLTIPVFPCQVPWSPTVSALAAGRGCWFFLWCDSSLTNIQKNWWLILRS